jgi:phage shock protein A
MPDTPGEDPENVLDAELVPPAAPEPVPVAPEDTGYTDSGVPTFESVRDKIENRFGTALGSAELDADTPEGRSVEEQYEARQRAAAERLAQIRAQMKSDDR